MKKDRIFCFYSVLHEKAVAAATDVQLAAMHFRKTGGRISLGIEPHRQHPIVADVGNEADKMILFHVVVKLNIVVVLNY